MSTNDRLHLDAIGAILMGVVIVMLQEKWYLLGAFVYLVAVGIVIAQHRYHQKHQTPTSRGFRHRNLFWIFPSLTVAILLLALWRNGDLAMLIGYFS